MEIACKRWGVHLRSFLTGSMEIVMVVVKKLSQVSSHHFYGRSTCNGHLIEHTRTRNVFEIFCPIDENFQNYQPTCKEDNAVKSMRFRHSIRLMKVKIIRDLE